MFAKAGCLAFVVIFLLVPTVKSQTPSKGAGETSDDDPNARPPVTQTDLQIVERARQILKSPSNWNRADTRVCPADAKTFSLYCALEKATYDVTGKFEHRGAAMQEARFVIEAVAPNVKNYDHRLMDYNNDPTTTFADIQKVLRLLKDRIKQRLVQETAANKKR